MMMRLPPADPSASTGRPWLSNTIVGDMEDTGRLPPFTALATGLPSFMGAKVKSVSSLLRKKPAAISWLPNGPSIVDVMVTTLPSLSTATKLVVPGTSLEGASVRGSASGGVPAS